MWPVEAELDRYLTVIRNKIRERGFTQLEVQETLGWGRSYISQLLTKQKTLKVEQVLLILHVIGVDSAEFFGELYARPQLLPEEPPVPVAPPIRRGETEEMSLLLRGLIHLLVEKRLVTGSEVRAAAEAADAEAAESPA